MLFPVSKVVIYRSRLCSLNLPTCGDVCVLVGDDTVYK